MVKGRLKTSCIVLVWFALTAIWNLVAVFTDIHHVTSFSYMALALFWAWSLRKEIVEPYIRRCLQTGGVMIFLLFALRFIRYSLKIPYEVVYRMLWYAYYIPIITLPMLSFGASIYIGGTDGGRTGSVDVIKPAGAHKLRPGAAKTHAKSAAGGKISDFISRKDLHINRKLMLLLTGAAAFFCTLMLTNDLHEWAFKIRYTDDGYNTTYLFLYYIIIVWYALLGLAAFAIMIRRCRISSCKKYIALPVVVAGVGILLWTWYYARGGSSPKIMGVSLFNIQEVFLLQFIGMWVSCIAIGLIPSRSLICRRDWIKRSVLDSIYDEYTSAKEYYDGLWKKDEDGFRETFDYHQLAGISTGYTARL
ncbi:MAG: hypothetical protein K6C95_09130 [Lachnospiraceae bacterium]|nr:hypothetical protein [Lachnospiraceae bacterium]